MTKFTYCRGTRTAALETDEEMGLDCQMREREHLTTFTYDLETENDQIRSIQKVTRFTYILRLQTDDEDAMG